MSSSNSMTQAEAKKTALETIDLMIALGFVECNANDEVRWAPGNSEVRPS